MASTSVQATGGSGDSGSNAASTAVQPRKDTGGSGDITSPSIIKKENDNISDPGENTVSVHLGPAEKEYIRRFLIVGRPELKYEPGREQASKDKDFKEVGKYIQSLISDGKGKTAVELIKEIVKNYRNIHQEPAIYCLAVCARSDNPETKREAYGILNDICRIPTHLFQFIEYYTTLTKERHERKSPDKVKEKEDKRKDSLKKKQEALDDKNDIRTQDDKPELKMKKMNRHAAYGWGRSFKRAIAKWFLSFSDPKYLAYLLTKYRRRCGWSVKTVIRLAHIKFPDLNASDNERAIGLILRYFRFNLQKACKYYNVDTLEENSLLREVARMLEDYNALRRSDNKMFIMEKIEQDIKNVRSKSRLDHTITIEHLSTQVLSGDTDCKDIWRTLIPCIPGDALIRHTAFLTRMGVFENNHAVKGFETRLKEFIKQPVATTSQTPYSTQRPIHPFRILLALLQYKGRHGTQQGVNWFPLDEIISILQTVFEESLGSHSQHTDIETKVCIAIDISKSLEGKPINDQSYAINCSLAAQAVAFTLAKTAKHVDVVIFNEKGCGEIDTFNSFNDFQDAIKNAELESIPSSDGTAALKWAQAPNKNRKDIEAFVVFTVEENIGGLKDPGELESYRMFSNNNNVRLITCTMNVTKVTATDSTGHADQHRFNICGCDPNLLLLIEEFLK